jgi:hypothetical protein
VGSACLGLESSPCFVTNAALAVATLGKSVPSWRGCDFYVTRRGRSSWFVTMLQALTTTRSKVLRAAA